MAIILGFDQSAYLMGWAHVAQMICTSKLEGSYVLRDPAFAHAVDFLIADYTSTTRCFPHLKTPVRRELPARGCSQIFNIDERHEYSL